MKRVTALRQFRTGPSFSAAKLIRVRNDSSLSNELVNNSPGISFIDYVLGREDAVLASAKRTLRKSIWHLQ